MSHETIHSGHFMTSNPHTETPIDDEDEDVEVDVVEDEEKPGLKRKESVATDEKPVTFYKFGKEKTQSFAIDASLNKLNKCIKVAYNKMTTPKWKDFKGLRLHWKQRIRLNNVIWRAYHMEFGRPLLTKKKSPYCFFAVPDDDSTHVKIEGTVLEGMYWKRRVEAVCAQYKKWRHFNRPKGHHAHHLEAHKRSLTSKLPLLSTSLYLDSFGKKKETMPMRSQTPKNTSTEYFDIDDLENEFTDTLFESLNAPYMFPNPREIGNSGNADFMQPGLLPLQPSLEEIMASLINYDDDDSVSFLDLAPGPSSSNFNVPRPLSPLRVQQAQQQQQQQATRVIQQQQPASAPVIQQPANRRPPPHPHPGKRITAAYEQQQQQHHLHLQQQQQQQAAAAAAAEAQRRERQLQQQQQQRAVSYSSKEYLAATMLVDYSNQSPARPATASSSGLQQLQQSAAAAAASAQPTRQSSIGSPMMLSQPQYTSATQYGVGGALGTPLSVPEWKSASSSLSASIASSPLMGALGATGAHLAATGGLGGLAGGGANSFLVTGGDVIPANMDYMPQFLSAAAAAGGSAPSPSALMMQAAARGLYGIPGISSASSSMSIGSPATASAFSSNPRWWTEQLLQQPSTSTAVPSPAAPSPLLTTAAASPAAAAAAAAALLTRSQPHLVHHGQSPSTSYGGGGNFVDPHGLVPSPGSGRLQLQQRAAAAAASAASLPRDTLSERLGSRSVLVEAAAASASAGMRTRGGGVIAAGAPLSAPVDTCIQDPWERQQQQQQQQQPKSADPWDRDDPCSSRRTLFPKEESDQQASSQEMLKEEEEEDMEVGGGAAATVTTLRPVRPSATGGKRGTKQVPADSTLHPTERKRILHLHAEQSRRMALKDGFDQLMEIVPDVHSGGIKPTNAVVLAKAADHIKALLAQKEQKAKRVADMRETIRALNERICSLQSSLPSSSCRDQASSSLDQRSAIEQFFERYTRERTKEDWRFWLMARLFKPIVSRYAAAVHDDPADKEEVAQSAAAWMAEEWRVAKLRPLSSEVLVYLATNTRVLGDPASLQAHIEQQVNGK